MPIILGSGSGGGTTGLEIGYDQITAPVTVVSGTESAGTLCIQGSAYTFSGAPVIAECFAAYISTGASATLIVSLFEGATQITRMGVFIASSLSTTLLMRYKFSPASGSHTYKITSHIVTNNGSFGAGSGGTGGYPPSYLRFTYV